MRSGDTSDNNEAPFVGIAKLTIIIPVMTTISFKVSKDEARLIQSRAKQEGVSVSESLRRRARISMPGPQKTQWVRCPHTGAMIFAAPEDQPSLTAESVRELLSDFP